MTNEEERKSKNVIWKPLIVLQNEKVEFPVLPYCPACDSLCFKNEKGKCEKCNQAVTYKENAYEQQKEREEMEQKYKCQTCRVKRVEEKTENSIFKIFCKSTQAGRFIDGNLEETYLCFLQDIDSDNQEERTGEWYKVKSKLVRMDSDGFGEYYLESEKLTRCPSCGKRLHNVSTLHGARIINREKIIKKTTKAEWLKDITPKERSDNNEC